MAKHKFGVAVSEDVAREIDDLTGECEDLGTTRSEVIEAILTAFVQSEINHTNRVRELIIRRRKGTL